MSLSASGQHRIDHSTSRRVRHLEDENEVKIHTLERPSKRLKKASGSSQDKENARMVVRSPQKGKGRATPMKAGSTIAEDMLMEDLMAGLDAELFDNVELSPSQKVESQHSPRKFCKRHSPAKGRRPLSPFKRQHILASTSSPDQSSKLQSVVGAYREHEPLVSPTRPSGAGCQAFKGQADPIEDEEEAYDFDLDLGDMLVMDESVFDVEPKTKFPILNPPIPSPPNDYHPLPWARCRVQAVYEGLRSLEDIRNGEQNLAAGPSRSSAVTLVVKMMPDELERVIHLKDRWAHMPISAGDVVNILSGQIASGNGPIQLSLKNPRSFLIHHPDLMLTMTSIANAMPCPRRPILQSLLKERGPQTQSMLYGNLQHSLLQRAMAERDFSVDSTRAGLEEALSSEVTKLDIWGADLSLEDVRVEMGGRAGQAFSTFWDKWVTGIPQPNGALHATTGEPESFLAINGLHDIEEDIWSPKWGLKGKVDASVQAVISKQAGSTTDVEEHIAPLEIKTGRSVGVMAHRAQTMLYTLLMEDRYNVPVPAGLLYYSQLDAILRVEAKQNEIRALIMARNELASYLAKQRTLPEPQLGTQYSFDLDLEDTSFLPPPIDNPKECKSCYAVNTCMLYQKAESRLGDTESPVAELMEEKTGHLTEQHIEFFKKWETLLTIEEQDIGRFRSQLWTMSAKERERTGRCFSNMVISSYSNDLGKSLAKIHRHTYTFTRSSSASQNASLLSGHIAEGDPVSLSIEPDLLCLSRGFVTALSPDSISIGVTYVIDTSALLARTKHRNHKMQGDRVEFRIDKDEMTSGLLKMRANLAQLFFAGGAESLRRLVVDLDPPRFEEARLAKPEEIPSSLNADQAKALGKVLTAKDYALILGKPGTGKTSTIAEIIKALVDRGKTVLLTSYTHSAVDTILMKLLNAEFGTLRLGNIDKVHPDVQHLTLEAMEASVSMPQFEARLMGPPVVATTCLSIDHPLFFRRRFDYCIVDEASQITLPTCLGPLALADTFVLVGDHFQLPPIVRNRDARQGGLDVSLFKTLSEAHPSAVTDLSYQYRMNEDIMLLSNRLIYEERLKCGSEQVARQSLKLPKALSCGPAVGEPHVGGPHVGGSLGQSCWIRDLLDESVKAVFVDTDQVPALDSKIGSLVQNAMEATFVHQLATALTTSGVKESDIAVITPYRQQIKLLTGLFASLPRIEILTADKSQGRDKDCVIISLVRSNKEGNSEQIGDLLKDWRRINVSFTRAKRKLVIFGSKSTLELDPLLGRFLDLMKEKNWVYTLPSGSDKLHAVADIASKAETKSEKGSTSDDTLGRSANKERSAKLGDAVLRDRPLMRDLVAETKDSC